VVVGILETDAGRLFNSSVLIGPGGVMGTYRKFISMSMTGDGRRPGMKPLRWCGSIFRRCGLSDSWKMWIMIFC
jgi:hypothetical protein